MRPLLFCSLLAASLATLAPAAPVPTHLMPKEVQYYPAEVGAKWVWDWSVVTPSDMTFVITKVEMTNEGRLVTSALEDGDKLLPADKVLITPKGLLLIERGGGKFDPPVCILKLPHKPGETWVTTTTFMQSECTYKHRALEAVEVKVPAGRFQTLPVVEDTGGGFWPQTHWYAPGVGRVKSTTPGGMKNILQSFRPFKD